LRSPKQQKNSKKNKIFASYRLLSKVADLSLLWRISHVITADRLRCIARYRHSERTTCLKLKRRKTCRFLAETQNYVGAIMQNEIKSAVTKEEFAGILRMSISTFDRQLSDAKQGKNNLPLPINSPGRRLLWSRKAIEEFINENSLPARSPQVESPSKLKKRHAAAMQKLSKDHGVTVKSQPRNQ